MPALRRPQLGQRAGPIEAGFGFLGELRQPGDPILQIAGGDYDAYSRLLTDDQVASCMQQRILAQTSAEWIVEAGGPSASDKAAADFITAELARIDFDRLTARMLHGVFFGYAVAECIWRIGAGGNVEVEDIRARKQSRFRFDRDGNLRLITMSAPMGEIMPDRKFWVFAYGGEHDDDPYGRGLASHLYWPVFFKRHAGEFWSIALERFGSPTTVGKYPPQALEADKKAALEAAQAASSDRSIAIPSSVELELLEAGQRAGGDYERFLRYWDAAIAKIILSQTMTTDDGSSRAQAQVHLDVREDVVKADADLICRSFNSSVVAWLTEWNFPGAVPPRVWRDIEPPADLDARAVRDKALVEAGLQPTQDYVTETYGDGWEIAAAPPAPADQARYMPAQPPDTAAEAPPHLPRDATDQIVGRLLAEAGDETDEMVARLRAIVDGATDMGELSERLLAALPGISPEALAQAVGDALVVAHLAGLEGDGA